jgi:hypothetical protein
MPDINHRLRSLPPLSNGDVMLRAAAFAAGLGLAACGPPPEAMVEPSAAVAGLPSPELLPTVAFDAAQADAAPAAERIGAGSEALAGRAEALRARAAGLDAPVLTPDERARLEAAAGR